MENFKKPGNVNKLISYQDTAVVSKTVLKKSQGSVTLFAFAKGEGLSDHSTPFDALVFVTDGTAEITIAGKVNSVSAGEMIIMPAHKPHALTAVIPFKMMLVMIKE
ncbi:MAG: cupin domain-containing protein [Candidatus Neomarinimicrobiota bacterium]